MTNTIKHLRGVLEFTESLLNSAIALNIKEREAALRHRRLILNRLLAAQIKEFDRG